MVIALAVVCAALAAAAIYFAVRFFRRENFSA